MRMFLSTQTYDLNGHVAIDYDADSDVFSKSRRTTRTATMDGGCTFDDLGFSWTDTTMNLKLSGITQEKQDEINYLVQNYSPLVASTVEGAFLVIVDIFTYSKGNAELRLLIVGEA